VKVLVLYRNSELMGATVVPPYAWEEEFVANQERIKPHTERAEEERAKVDELRGAPMSVGSLEEIIDDKCVPPFLRLTAQISFKKACQISSSLSTPPPSPLFWAGCVEPRIAFVFLLTLAHRDPTSRAISPPPSLSHQPSNSNPPKTPPPVLTHKKPKKHRKTKINPQQSRHRVVLGGPGVLREHHVLRGQVAAGARVRGAAAQQGGAVQVEFSLPVA
jgi:hypothetical protein